MRRDNWFGRVFHDFPRKLGPEDIAPVRSARPLEDVFSPRLYIPDDKHLISDRSGEEAVPFAIRIASSRSLIISRRYFSGCHSTRLNTPHH